MNKVWGDFRTGELWPLDIDSLKKQYLDSESTRKTRKTKLAVEKVRLWVSLGVIISMGVSFTIYNPRLHVCDTHGISNTAGGQSHDYRFPIPDGVGGN